MRRVAIMIGGVVLLATPVAIFRLAGPQLAEENIRIHTSLVEFTNPYHESGPVEVCEATVVMRFPSDSPARHLSLAGFPFNSQSFYPNVSISTATGICETQGMYCETNREWLRVRARYAGMCPGR